MDTRALSRLSLVLGVLVALTAVVLIRRIHTEERGMEVVLVAALAIGAFLAIVGLVNVLLQQPMSEEEEERALAEAEVRGGPRVSVTTAVGIYLVVLSLIAAIVVGIAMDDAGAGIQTFTFGLILTGVIWGLGVLFGYRPVEEESQ